MRADRLISIIMLLQSQARMTANELSKELEVSPRTIYRDILSLNGAGIPIYSERGPGGGISLVDSYRTSLTGMNQAEAQALFMLNIPQALVELGVGQTLKNALLKLVGALPSRQQIVQAQTRQRIFLDSTSWDEPAEPSPHLGIVHQSVWRDKLIHMIYHGSFDTRLEFELEPLGLVAKMNTWYLVARYKEFIRVFNVSDIMEVEILEGDFIRLDDFDLAGFWQEWCQTTRDRRPVYPVRLKVAPTLLDKLHLYLGEAIKSTILDSVPPDGRGWRHVTIIYGNFFEARGSILGFGNAAEVLEPEPLRISVIDFAQQIVESYSRTR